MSVDWIEKQFVEELKDLFSAEDQITMALPKMVKAAASADLKKAFESHLRETEGQIERLKRSATCWESAPREVLRRHEGGAWRGLIHAA